MNIKNIFRVMLVFAFIATWFMHTTQPLKKSCKMQLNELKKQTHHKNRASRLKVVFGG